MIFAEFTGDVVASARHSKREIPRGGLTVAAPDFDGVAPPSQRVASLAGGAAETCRFLVRRRPVDRGDDYERVESARLIADVVDPAQQFRALTAVGDTVEQRHRIRGAPPARRPQQSTTIGVGEVRQEGVHQEFGDLLVVFSFAALLGETQRETHKAVGQFRRQIPLAHEPARLPRDAGNDAADPQPQPHHRHDRPDREGYPLDGGAEGAEGRRIGFRVAATDAQQPRQPAA